MPATGWGQVPVLDPPQPPAGWTPPPPIQPAPVQPDEAPGWEPLPDPGAEEPARVLPGAPGEQGPQGPAGPVGGRLIKRAAAPISGGRVVRLAEDGSYVDVASALSAGDASSIAGIAVQSAATRDEELEIVRFGELEDDGWNFVPFRRVFVGSNGQLTQTIDRQWSFVCILGTAMSPTKLMVDLRPPTFLAP